MSKTSRVITHVAAFGVGIASGTATMEGRRGPELPTEAEEQLVAEVMSSPQTAQAMRQLVLDVQADQDWSVMVCDDLLPEYVDLWSRAVGREAARRGWKVGLKQGRDDVGEIERLKKELMKAREVYNGELVRYNALRWDQRADQVGSGPQ